MALSLLAAERRRSITGRGESIVLSLADVALWATDALGVLAEVQLTGSARGRTGDFVYGTFGTHFATSDGPPVMVVALTNRQWADLISVTETADAVHAIEREVGESMSDEHARWRHRVRLRETLAPWFHAHSTAQIQDALRPTRLVSSALGTFEDVAAGPLVRENPRFGPLHHPKMKTVLAMRYPAMFAEASSCSALNSPLLGQDTEAVLSELLGFSAREIGDLFDRGVAAGVET